jgi:AcrR family transcriptional regulator
MSRRGYRGTSLKEIAKELGISEPALYHYFDSKEEMLFTIYIDTLNLSLEKVRGIGQSDGSPEEKLRRVIAEFTRVVTENKMFVIFFREKDELSPKNWKRITRGEREFVGAIRDIITDGIKDGTFKELPPTVLTFGILGMVAWVYRWFRPDGPLNRDQLIDVFSEMIIDGVRKA